MGPPASGALGALHGRARSTGAERAWTAPLSRPKKGLCHRPEPADRGKAGTKRHLVTDARGTPLGFRLSGANRHDSVMMAPTLDAIPPVRNGRRGRPRHRPDKLHADKAYDAQPRRHECRARGIAPRIARRGIESSERRGHRWVVERTHAWFNRFRRLPVRYEDVQTSTKPSPSLAASLITLKPAQTVLLGALIACCVGVPV